MAATATERAGKQSTRRPGKKRTGWEKVGVYLSSDAARRLDLAAISKGIDRSQILTDLVLSQLPHYVLSVRATPKVSASLDDHVEESRAEAA